MLRVDDFKRRCDAFLTHRAKTIDKRPSDHGALSAKSDGLQDVLTRAEEIATKLVENAGLDSVMTNSFGFGGTNGSMILSKFKE